MGLTLSDIEPVLEELYFSDKRIPDAIMRDNPTLAIIPKSEEGGGLYRHIPIKHVRPQGRSAVFATAQTNTVGSKRKGFDVTWVNNYATAEIDGNVIDDSGGNKVMLVDHVETEMDGAIENMKDDIAFGLFRNGGGARGQIATGGISATVVTLSNPEDAAHFEVGMVIVADTTDGTSGTVHTGSVTLVAVDRDGGTLTADQNWTTGISAAAAADYLFCSGDFGVKVSGFDAWNPLTVSATAFFGVDRTADKVRLGGVRYDGSGQPIDEALIEGSARIWRNKKGKKIDLGVLNPTDFAALTLTRESNKRFEEVQGSGEASHLGFKAFMLDTPQGDVPIISDPNCPVGVARMLNKASWLYETVGKMVRVIDDDGTKLLRKASSDSFELRLKSRGNLLCLEPGANGRIALV